ncbi:MAG: crotonase/enoyl-CoA hydratase family protein [Pseudomonadota bacterium]
MSEPTFTVTIDEKIAHVQLCRPDKANAMNPAFWRDFPVAIAEISDEAQARVIVISSTGRHFSAGMDLGVFNDGAMAQKPDNQHTAAEMFRHHLHGLQECFSALENARQPVLAAVQGGAIGAGVDLVTACDCRYATRDAFFCVQETAIGMTADVGTFPRLAKVIPEGWARQMAYTAERLPAEKAQAIGLVNAVYDDQAAMLDGVMEIAKTIAGHAPLAVTGSKRMLNYARDHTTADALDYIAVWNAGMLRNEDMQESFMAKAQKRTPVFDDLMPIRKKM